MGNSTYGKKEKKIMTVALEIRQLEHTASVSMFTSVHEGDASRPVAARWCELIGADVCCEGLSWTLSVLPQRLMIAGPAHCDGFKHMADGWRGAVALRLYDAARPLPGTQRQTLIRT